MVTHCVYDIANMITFLIVTRATCWVGVVKKNKHKNPHPKHLFALFGSIVCSASVTIIHFHLFFSVTLTKKRKKEK